MKIIAIHSRYITNKTKITLFEGNENEFKKFMRDNFKTWFNGIESSCDAMANKVIQNDISQTPMYIGEIAAWFQMIER